MMEMIDLRVRIPRADALDAAEDIEQLLERDSDEVLPPLRRLLFTLEDAIVESFADPASIRRRRF